MSKNNSLLIEANKELKELLSINPAFVDSRIDYTTENLVVYVNSELDLPENYKGIKIIKENKSSVIDYSDLQASFLAFTEYVVPFGHEKMFEPLLPSGWKQDKVGNYFYIIGESKTLFTTHLDNYIDHVHKVEHVIEDNDGTTIIKTDGKSILGGDNKLGVVILCNMITRGIPGTYFFFIGEEPIGKSRGLYGSKSALKNDPDFFSKFDRAIAFDRKELWSIVTRQMGRVCCSPEFVDSLASQFSGHGLPKYKADPTGYYTDTATFLDVIPECTNISVGGYNEHTSKEFVNMNYFIEVANAALAIDWENLPTVRERVGISKPVFVTKKIEWVFGTITQFMNSLGLICENPNHFNVGVPIKFNYWHNESDYRIVVNEDATITYKGETTDLEKFIHKVIEERLPKVDYTALGVTLDKANHRIIIKGDPQNIMDYLDDISNSDRAFLLVNAKKNGVWRDTKGVELSTNEVINLLEYEYKL